MNATDPVYKLPTFVMHPGDYARVRALRRFPEDPRGLSRDDVLRRPYGRPRAATRAEFVRRLAAAMDRPPMPPTVHVGLMQRPEPRHFVGGYPRQPQTVEATAQAFLLGGYR